MKQQKLLIFTETVRKLFYVSVWLVKVASPKKSVNF